MEDSMTRAFSCAAAAVLSVALAVAPAHRAAADAGDIAGGIIGGIIGGAIVNEVNKPRRTVVVRQARPAVSSYQREQNREMQTALNHFGFPAGAPDGVVGRNTRGAVAMYQAHLGYPPTGQLTQYERDFLVTSYHRSIAGGPRNNELIAQYGQGMRGLLIAYRDEQMGIQPGNLDL